MNKENGRKIEQLQERIKSLEEMNMRLNIRLTAIAEAFDVLNKANQNLHSEFIKPF